MSVRMSNSIENLSYDQLVEKMKLCYQRALSAILVHDSRDLRKTILRNVIANEFYTDRELVVIKDSRNPYKVLVTIKNMTIECDLPIKIRSRYE